MITMKLFDKNILTKDCRYYGITSYGCYAYWIINEKAGWSISLTTYGEGYDSNRISLTCELTSLRTMSVAGIRYNRWNILSDIHSREKDPVVEKEEAVAFIKKYFNAFI